MRDQIEETQINLVIEGLVRHGYEIYGDALIGYRAFNSDGEEYDFSNLLDFLTNDPLEKSIEYFSDKCDQVKAGNHSDCEWW